MLLPADARRGLHELRGVLLQADALTGVAASAGDAVDLRQVGVARDASHRRRRRPAGGRVRHGVGQAGTREQVFFFACGARCRGRGDAVKGALKAATIGAAATASANPPARMIRLAENSRGAIVTLSVVYRLRMRFVA